MLIVIFTVNRAVNYVLNILKQANNPKNIQVIKSFGKLVFLKPLQQVT